jgi:para-nitrobenzyl esterase
MLKSNSILMICLLFSKLLFAQQATPVFTTKLGKLQGVQQDGINIIKGVPYARTPVGTLRWKEPQAHAKWKGIRKAINFGPRAMQQKIYDDMVFRSDSTSEDCLYLNIWAPANIKKEKLAVLVYFHGGGFNAGDGSEPRYDGMSMAKKGIIMVTVNYRLGIFGFFAHPGLSKASLNHASGNYGLLDQNAALKWVKENIVAFGGDSAKVTIAGQSAGSTSVSLQIASPLSKGLFRAAIGESGSILNMNPPPTLKAVEIRGEKFVKSIGYQTVEELKALDARTLLKLSADQRAYFPIAVDGYFLPDMPINIYSTGKQADVELLAGWNSAEVNYKYVMGKDAPTIVNYKKTLKTLYGEEWERIFDFYPVKTDQEVPQMATVVASDRFAGFSTWKWIDLHGKTNGKRVYRYFFQAKPLSGNNSQSGNDEVYGAVHSAEIPFLLGNIEQLADRNYSKQDHDLSSLMQSYIVNFVKTGDPNGSGLPKWSGFQSSIPQVMMFGGDNKQEGEKALKRYQALDQIYYK